MAPPVFTRSKRRTKTEVHTEPSITININNHNMAIAGLPPSTRRRGGRGITGGADGNRPSSLIHNLDGGNVNVEPEATAARRWRGTHRSSIFVRILQFITILAISILLAITIDLRGSSSNAKEDSSSNIGGDGAGQSLSLASYSIEGSTTKNRIARDIESLENELRLLSAEYRVVSNEIAQFVNGSRHGGSDVITNVNKNGLEPEVIIFEGIEDVARKGVKISSDKDIARNEPKELQKRDKSSQTNEEKIGDLRKKKKKAREEEGKDTTTKHKVTPKKYWIRANLSMTEESMTFNNNHNDEDSLTSIKGIGGVGGGAIIPIDLSVNHLQRIIRVPGSPGSNSNNDDSHDDTNSSVSVIEEEFLPVVQSHEIDFRWRSRARPNSKPEDAVRTSAYRIVARRAQYSASLEEDDAMKDDEEAESMLSSILLWDSGKVSVPDGLPDVVHCSDTQLTNKAIIGSIIEWRVTVWDSRQPQPWSSTSSWTKFAIGPTQQNGITNYDDDTIDETDTNDNNDDDDDGNGWKARWISHPIDVESWDKTDGKAFWANIEEHREIACRNWEKRSQLPIFRAKLKLPKSASSSNLVAVRGENENSDDEIASALLVVSGLGSFRASFDGVPLSSSGPLDPPFTDFSQRVSYRGFDVTRFLKRINNGDGSGEGEHVVGISMGSGWWDHRPLTGDFIRLFYFPRGAVTCIAQLYVTFKSGKTEVFLPTGRSSSGWQAAKGHLRESSLFSGEYIDLQTMATFEGWDTIAKWSDVSPSGYRARNLHSWVEPKLYKSDMTLESWRNSLHIRAHASSTRLRKPVFPDHTLSPIGKLVPNEIPPVLPMERIYPEELYGLGQGRWMIDFGKGISGMVRFENGVSSPIVPSGGNYPRGHSVSTLSTDESFITVVYGESLQMESGDINIALVAGMGLHDGGPKHKVKGAGYVEAKGGPCYPKDHIKDGSLLQRDVYILPRNTDSSIKGSFSHARQSHFTTHSFRFAELCCLAEPPSDVYAMSYRTAFNEWGSFSSSNIRINGGYELTKNALNSNMLSVQSDCPHREKIQYGGDLIADSPASLHLYDLSSFYRKVINDWRNQQWDNGAYAGTSIWLALNDYAGIGDGSGETVWASAPILLTARHFQHYGDLRLLEESFGNHLKWFDFLRTNFDKGMTEKGYLDDLKGYTRDGSGLGDWLSLRGRDTWLTHQSFYMATARCIAYIASQLEKSTEVDTALELANSIRERISRLYLRKDGSFLPPEASQLSPGPEMSLFSRVVPGDQRCLALRNYFKRKGHSWPGSEENAFLAEISDSTMQQMISSGELTKRGDSWSMGWSQWHGFSEGILAIRYALKTLSDNGFHNIALSKASGFGIGTFEYMLSHNATTLWESWWRSEDLYSHNHPMLGAAAEWMVSAVAGVGLHPETTGGKRVLFWPRFPNSARALEYASATQGTRRGDFSVAWKFEDLPNDIDLYDSAVVKVRIRLFVPPDGSAIFRLPEYGNGDGVDSVIRFATLFPDIVDVNTLSAQECSNRRKARKGFDYNWEYDREEKQWKKVHRKKSIGTPCRSFLFHAMLSDVAWSSPETVHGSSENGIELELGPGLYDVIVDNWKLKPEVRGKEDWRIESMYEFYEGSIGPYCSDLDTFDWNVNDALHLI